MNLNELVIKDEKELTIEQLSFLDTHKNILTSGAVISNGLISLAQNLKKMRDEKLYLEAGFETFASYTDIACNLKERQAYNYIKILESFSEEFLHSNAKIGVAKLSLLTTLSEEDRVEISDKVVIEDVSVSKLKEEIQKLKLKDSNNTLELQQLKDELMKEKSKTSEVVTKVIEDTTSKDKIKELEEKLKLQKQENKEIQEKFKTTSNQAEDLRKQLEINNSTELVEFKLCFDELQNLIIKIKNLIPSLPEDKKDGCRQALRKVGETLC